MARDFPQTSLIIEQGQTWTQVLRWEAKPELFKAITAISKTGAARLTVPGHGLPDGWRGAIEGVKGMVEINALRSPPRSSDYHRLTVVDSSTIEINDINTAAVDDNGDDLYSTYTSGGTLRCYTPVDLAGFTFDIVVLDRVGGTVLASSRSTDAPLNILTATGDNAAKTITLGCTVANVNALTWTRGHYDVYATDSLGVVTKLMEGQISVSRD